MVITNNNPLPKDLTTMVLKSAKDFLYSRNLHVVNAAINKAVNSLDRTLHVPLPDATNPKNNQMINDLTLAGYQARTNGDFIDITIPSGVNPLLVYKSNIGFTILSNLLESRAKFNELVDKKYKELSDLVSRKMALVIPNTNIKEFSISYNLQSEVDVSAAKKVEDELVALGYKIKVITQKSSFLFPAFVPPSKSVTAPLFGGTTPESVVSPNNPRLFQMITIQI